MGCASRPAAEAGTTDEGLANLSHLKKLYQLYLGGNAGITDAGLKHLSPILAGRIEILGLQNTGITQRGLAALREWSRKKKRSRPQISHSLVTPQVYK